MKTLERLMQNLCKSVVLVAALLMLASPQEASAQTLFVTDCFSGFQNTFSDNEPVCATGNAGGSFLGVSGLVCILPSTGGGPGDEVTGTGCRAVPAAGTFSDEFKGRAKRLHVNLAWQGSATATAFQVFRRLDTEVNFSNVGQVANRVFVDDLPIGTLSAEYFVTASNNFGASDPSAVVTVVPRSRR